MHAYELCTYENWCHLFNFWLEKGPIVAEFLCFGGVNSSDAQMPHRSEPLDCAANLANMYSVGETHQITLINHDKSSTLSENGTTGP